MSNEKQKPKTQQPQTTPENPPAQTQPSPQPEVEQTRLAQLLTQIGARREFLSEQHQEYDYTTKLGIHGLTIAREQAKTDIAMLQIEYERRVAQVCARIFVIGGDSQGVKDTLLSASEMEAVTVQSDALYDSIARKVLPYLGEPPKMTIRASEALVQAIAVAYLRYAPESAWPKVPMQMLEGHLGTTGEAVNANLLQIIRTVVRQTAEKPVQAVFAQEVCIKEALRLEVVEEPLAIVVTGLTKEDIPDFENHFFPGRPFTVIDLDTVKRPEVALKAAAKVLAKQMGLETK